jgi:hypothetical protein
VGEASVPKALWNQEKDFLFHPVPAFGAFLDLVIGHYPTRSELAEANQEGLAA